MDDILDKQVGGNHYKQQTIQPIEYIIANKLDFCRGNIVKYITRDKFKEKDDDIKKVIDYAIFILKFDYKYDDKDIKNYFKERFNI